MYKIQIPNSQHYYSRILIDQYLQDFTCILERIITENLNLKNRKNLTTQQQWNIESRIYGSGKVDSMKQMIHDIKLYHMVFDPYEYLPSVGNIDI